MNASLQAPAGALEESIRNAVGNGFRLADDPLPPVGGSGQVNGQDRRLFGKLMPAADAARLDAEADGLAAIAATGTIRTPAVIVRGEAGGVAWLVLEWLDLHPIADDAAAGRAAEALAAMHRIEGDRFGWHRDNFIGATPQANPESDNWSRFSPSSDYGPNSNERQPTAIAASFRRMDSAWSSGCRHCSSTSGRGRACFTATCGTATSVRWQTARR